MSQKKMKKKSQDAAPEEDEEQEDVMCKLDYKIIDYLKANTPTKKTKFLAHQVDYFYAHKAVNVLLDSEWATGDDVMFTDRQSVVDYLNRLLDHKIFHRAKKIPVTDKDYASKKLKKKRQKEEKEKRKKADYESEPLMKKDAADSEEELKKDKEKDKIKDKSKKKIKLDMHLEQVFIDGSDAYIWMYEPMPSWYYAAGFLCLVATVAVCLFPLWPPSVRQGVYYLSVAAACFLGVILGLAVLRFILFIFIWVLSLGRHHLWILPNLTEDVGFFESFVPLYYYEYRGSDYIKGKKKKKKKKVVVKSEEEVHSYEPTDDGGEAIDDNCLTQTEDENVGQTEDENVGQTEEENLEHSDESSNDADNALDDEEEAIERHLSPGVSDSEASQPSQAFEVVTTEDLH